MVVGGTFTAVGDPVPINGDEADGGFDPTAPIDEGPTGDVSETAPLDPSEFSAIGSAATMGTWEVTITGWSPDATAEVAGVNADNPEPSNGEYGLVSMTAINRGDVEATAWFNLTFGLAGGDGQEFADADCRTFEANGLAGSDPVQPGASISADAVSTSTPHRWMPGRSSSKTPARSTGHEPSGQPSRGVTL